MPEQVAGQGTSEWTPETVEKQAAELEQQAPEKPEPEQVETPEPEAKVKEERVVPLAAVQEERAKRREANQRVQSLEAEVQQLRRAQLEFMQRMQQPQVQRDPNDVVGQLNDGIQRTQQEIQALRNANEQRAMQEQQAAQWQQFVNHVHQQEAEFTKEQPDALEAINFLKNSRLNQYKAAGLSHAQALARLGQDERDLTISAVQNGDNPARVAFDMAVAGGYVGGSKKLEMQRQGQGASMPSGGSGKAGGAPSLEALLKMDGKDFAKATEGDNWAKLLKKYS